MTFDLSVVGWKSEPTEYRYDWRQLALYALGIGAQVGELDYLYEGLGPKSFPTFAVVPGFDHVFACIRQAQIPFSSVLHGSQTVRVVGALPPDGKLFTQGEILACHDMKKFAQVVVGTRTWLENEAMVYETQWGIIVRGAGGFGGQPPPKSEVGKVPSTSPDFRIAQKTLPEQGLLYRLSGDANPLHADPDAARKVGFEKGPILHGLATFGFAARAVIAGACQGDATRLEVIHGQFRRPVWPGDTLTTEGWLVDDQVLFQTSVKERDETVISGAWARIKD